MNKDQQRILLRYMADKEELKGLSNRKIADKVGVPLTPVLAMSQDHAAKHHGASLDKLSMGQISAIRLALGRRKLLEDRSRRQDLADRLATTQSIAEDWLSYLRKGKMPRRVRPGSRPGAAKAVASEQQQANRVNQWLMRPLVSGRYYEDQEAA